MGAHRYKQAVAIGHASPVFRRRHRPLSPRLAPGGQQRFFPLITQRRVVTDSRSHRERGVAIDGSLIRWAGKGERPRRRDPVVQQIATALKRQAIAAFSHDAERLAYRQRSHAAGHVRSTCRRQPHAILRPVARQTRRDGQRVARLAGEIGKRRAVVSRCLPLIADRIPTSSRQHSERCRVAIFDAGIRRLLGNCDRRRDRRQGHLPPSLRCPQVEVVVVVGHVAGAARARRVLRRR